LSPYVSILFQGYMVLIYSITTYNNFDHLVKGQLPDIAKIKLINKNVAFNGKSVITKMAN
jgi:hypothetical protein